MGGRVESALVVVRIGGVWVLRRVLGCVFEPIGRRCGAGTLLPIAGACGVVRGGAARGVRAAGAVVMCVIVGLSLGSGDAVASSRSLEQVRVPGLQNGELFAVSCRSSSWCLAVGSISDTPDPGAVQRPLVERWDGSRWTYEGTPEPAGTTRGGLTAVSCVSERTCVAVGWVTKAQGPRAGLVERWNGSSWSIDARAPSGPGLDGVSCASVGFCVVVGGSVFELWESSRWSLRRSVKGAELAAVSCVSRRACAAVGSRHGRTLAEWFDGSRWSIEPTPNPAAAPDLGGPRARALAGVSCTSAGACTAVGASISYTPVGNSEQGEQDNPLALRWDGRSWTRERSPTTDLRFRAVSCTASTACLALGDDAQPRVYAWTGYRWKAVRDPAGVPTGAGWVGGLPGPGAPFLNGVSCTRSNACTIVGALNIGFSGSGRLTFAERWNGRRLLPESTSTAADRAARAVLNGVVSEIEEDRLI